ncbi:histone-like nucleoid-structuring protein Lsr2 [Streptomyces werraensis]|uniref:histone-like nucleoid-structuring protein Lsr2 n=1 Tax=Streptomyces werraensis TaxID=68284 RepID=UPI003F4DD381
MAKLIQLLLLDDLANDDTTQADETVTFSLDGVDYEIDLTAENAHTLRTRLKPFTQAGRVIGRNPKRAAKPRPHNAHATPTSKHQAEQNTAAIRAWAVKEGLLPAGQRGRLAHSVRQAYTAAHTPGSSPTRQTQPHTDPQPTTTADNTDEAEARRHYKPLTRRTPEMQDDAKWARRVGTGNERTEKIEDWTLTERLHSLKDRHLTILGQLSGLLDVKNGKISGLATSERRLQNLEFIETDPSSDHGWKVTDFGRYALQWHSRS